MGRRLRTAGLWLGPVLALLVYLLLPDGYQGPDGQWLELPAPARAAAAVGSWMAVWWLTEAIPVYATALLPLVAFPLAGVTSVKATAASYGHELIFLFLGGFVLALALERWGVHKRVALTVLSAVGTHPARVVGAFMGISALTSMWVMNTATTIMLLPVALSVLGLARSNERTEPDGFSSCLLLGIAYAASIGGIGTIVGTAPNLFLVSFIQTRMGIEISFARWMAVGIPLVFVFVPLCWWLLVKVIYRLRNEPVPGLDRMMAELHAGQGSMSTGERLTLAVFMLTALAWITRPLLVRISIDDWQPLGGLTDPGIAVAAALLLFVIPVRLRSGEFLMDWETAVKLPWGLLILFGGGLSLAAALDKSGFSAYLGSQVSSLAALPVPLLVGLVVALVIFLTELTSNTATTATLIPVLYAVAVGLGLDPFLLIVPAGIAASCAFMLPVATPPNAVVFGSGLIRIPEMARAGLWLNLIGIPLVTGLVYLVALPLLGSLL